MSNLVNRFNAEDNDDVPEVEVDTESELETTGDEAGEGQE